MELKRLVTHFAYNIEPKPEGGFIARATDPSVPALEAPTRAELQQKIQQNIVSALSAEFPQLKEAVEGKTIDMGFHVERTPQGGFEIHSADPNAAVMQASSQKDFESQFLEKFLNFAGKHIVPELSAALAAQAGSGNVKVTVNKKVSFKLNAGSRGLTFGTEKSSEPGTAGKFVNSPDPTLANFSGAVENQPITPEANNFWKVFGLVFLVLIIGAVAYFFLRFR